MAAKARTNGASTAATPSTPAAPTTGIRASSTSTSQDPEQRAAIEAGRVPQEPYFENGVQVERPMGVFSDTLWTDRMIGYLEEAREADKPFFAYLAFTTPHAPLQAPDWLIDKYVDHYLALGFEGLKRARWESQKRHRTHSRRCAHAGPHG